MDDLKAQLKDERMKNREMDSKLQMVNINKIMLEHVRGFTPPELLSWLQALRDRAQSSGLLTRAVEQLQERISDLEQERELLKESNKNLLER